MNLSLPLLSASDDAPPLAGGVPLPGPGAAAADAGQPPAAAGRAPAFDLAQHPSVWRASQVGGAARRVSASGFDALDAELPGGGWPHGVLTELLLPEPGIGELRLLAPALAGLAGAPVGDRPAVPGAAPADGRCVMLFDPPALLSAWALAQRGLASRHWLVVQGRAGQPRAGPAGVILPHAGPAGVILPHAGPAGVIAPGAPRGANRLAPLLPSADLLWALEQSLKSGHLGAVLAWLPLNLRADTLRRLQLAAQSHDGPVFVFRDALARSQPSVAPLRLLLQPAGADRLSVRLLKRRGPALAQPLRLVLPPVLAPQLQAQAEAREAARERERPASPAARTAP